MLTKVDALTGQGLMRLWGVESWVDPGAEYVTWNDCCVFAMVAQDGFVDVHIAMDKRHRHECREAGAELLEEIRNLKLRLVILPDRPFVCNFASRMGFSNKTTEILTTSDGSQAPFIIMWREPGEYYGRFNQRTN